MIDLHLCAGDEAELAAALPWLRTTNEDDDEVWLTGSMHHALDAGLPIITSPAVLAGDGTVATPAVFAEGYHLNLRLTDEHPELLPIICAAEPFCVEPTNPQRVFA